MLPTEIQERIRQSVQDEASFVGATFSGRQRGHDVPWARVTLRPVQIRSRWHVQFSYFDGRQDITRNYSGAELRERLDELLNVGFNSMAVKSTAGNFNVQITKKGRAILHEQPASTPDQPDLAHDRRKQRALPAGDADAFLKAVGIMAQDGRIRANMQDKYKQINKFLEIVEHTGELQTLADDAAEPLYLVDAGCGNAYLTFATYHYLNHVRGIPTQLTGIDVNTPLLDQHAQKAQDLHWQDIDFEATSIIDFRPERAPDMVIALHACDTATDEALAQAVAWNSRLIFCSPCCHHHLQAQMDAQPTPAPFGPVARHGILRERLGDILTDTLRALILRIMGYRTDVMQFISTEHTSRNLMIRAVLSAPPGDARFIAEYMALKDFWGVTPYLETLLGEDFAALLAAQP